MNVKRILLTMSTIAVAMVGVLFLALLLRWPSAVHANPAATTRYVATTGNDGGGSNDCATAATPCRTVQHALDRSVAGDEIRVATGLYTGVQARDSMTQVVYVSETVTLRGGYTTADWGNADPQANPTILDAQRQGRAIAIVGNITPTLEGFIVTGGNAAGQLTGCPTSQPDGCGGGIFVYDAHPLILNNVITDNVAAVTSAGYPTGTTGYGGGLYLRLADRALVSGNVVISNVGGLAGNGRGGGIDIDQSSDVQVSSNQVFSNVASKQNTGWGGGLSVRSGSGTVQGNHIEGNLSSPASNYGAGLYQWYGFQHFLGNQITGNKGNHAVYLGHSRARFEANRVVDNASTSGIYLIYGQGSGLTLTNNLVAHSGDTSVAVEGYLNGPLTVTLLHNTLVGSGTGYGAALVDDYGTLLLTNNIASGYAWGITNTYTDSVVMADHTLFWDNDNDGLQGTNAVNGDPAFIDPVGRDYRLGPDSAAIDAGVDAGVTADMEGDPRPIGPLPDIGMDEAPLPTFSLAVTVAGDGNGSVSSDPAGINCDQDGGVCNVQFVAGTQVTLTAASGISSTFSGWGGACSGTGTCQITLDSSKQVTATFALDEAPPTFSLAVTIAGDGNGSVSSDPASINCDQDGGVCNVAFTAGTQVTLTAASGLSSTFSGWSGACSGTGMCQVTLDASRQVTATFTLDEVIEYDLFLSLIRR